MVKDGMMTATCAQFPLVISEKAVEQAYMALKDRNGFRGEEVIVPVELITEENVDQFGTDGWQ